MSANIKNENTEHVDLTSILKDVENCIRSGLSNKLDTFFYEYDKYKKTHEEVLNLSIVRELLKRGSSVTSNVSEGTKPKLDPELEMIVLRNQVIFLRGEVNKYKNQAEALVLAQAPEQAPQLESEQESSQLNLEIKEKETEPLDIKSEDEDEDGDGDGDISDNDGEEDGDGDVSETSSNGDGSDDDTGIANTKYLPHIVEDSIQNIVLNVTEKNAEVVADEEQAEEEEEEAEEEAEEEVVADEEEAEEEEEEVVADEEEEDLPVKMPTFPTKTKPEPAVEVKPVIVEEEEEEEEDEVETETEEDSDEEEEAEAAPAPAPELKTSAPEEEEEEEEEELYEVEINGVMYVTNDDEDGTIYSYDNEEVGDKAGEFKGTVAHIYNGKNKGIYDRTLCKMDF